MSLTYRQIRILKCDRCDKTLEASREAADAIDARIEARLAGWSTGKRRGRAGRGRMISADYCSHCTAELDGGEANE